MTQKYGENFLSDGVAREWRRKFKDARTDDEGAKGHQSDATEDIVQGVNQVVGDKQGFAISELKNWLGCKRFQTNDQLQATFQTHLTSLAATLFEDRIGKLVHRYYKCLNLRDGYVEK